MISDKQVDWYLLGRLFLGEKRREERRAKKGVRRTKREELERESTKERELAEG